MIFVLTYDIHFEEAGDKNAQRRLAKLYRYLCDYGFHRQRSLFEFDVEMGSMQKILLGVKKIINKETDSVAVYPLCEKCLKRVVVQGVGEKIEIKDFEIV
ncbi:MAG: CRISPR-associated endonuclease Cas2 [Deltaproteobacteria bacterium]|nr:CRISPR-associated endonuclease Cas2 [Deltaproteobacteria bacterium]